MFAHLVNESDSVRLLSATDIVWDGGAKRPVFGRALSRTFG